MKINVSLISLYIGCRKDEFVMYNLQFIRKMGLNKRRLCRLKKAPVRLMDFLEYRSCRAKRRLVRVLTPEKLLPWVGSTDLSEIAI